ncbi:hypothetical protein F8S09_04525 [Deinococcus sp. SDU3-2]|uniref:Lipoprotein n=1 Tax=Deinococcus terrestris TaxID=2651870 RepID=A0A7X1NUB1_9DEIO|nr:hypothetical protein [Deinococcus terrestris]MPY65962.1 hypothetical protein [Deinococcus terrestris]
MKNFAVLTLASTGLLLAACNQTPAPSSLAALSGTVVEGSFTETATSFRLTTGPWTGGAGSVRGYLVGEDGLTGQPATTGTLTADGKFVLTLPTPTAAQLSAIDTDLFGALPEDYDFAADCLPQITLSDRSVRSTSLLVEVDAGKDGAVQPATLSLDGTPGQGRLTFSFGGLTYVDRSVTLKGNRTCTVEGERLTVQTDLRLGKGWNKVQLAVTGDEATGVYTVSAVSGSFSSDNWVFLDADLTGLSLKSKLPKPTFLGR